MRDVRKITVLGAGSWGTTLAVLLCENSFDVTIWEFFPDHAETVSRERENKKFLPGVRIPERIAITSDLGTALVDSGLILFALPTHTIRKSAENIAQSRAFNPAAIIVNASKGLEEGTMKRMSEVLTETLPVESSVIFSLMGPSHAEEVSRRVPTSVVVAGDEGDTIKQVQQIFFTPYFRVYTNHDQIGVEIGVSLKNIIAIAAGVCDGLGYGDNTKAALITRGLMEITRLGCALGARRETFFGLAGIGDLIVTCLSRHSRNRHVGERIGKGESLNAILESMVMVAEGVRTTHAAVDLGKKMEIELPIIESIDQVLFHGKDPNEAIIELMNRPLRDEMRWTT